MNTVALDRVTSIYSELVNEIASWLRAYLKQEGELAELLSGEDIHFVDETSLNYLFKYVERVTPAVRLNLYSVKPDMHTERTYYVGIKSKKGLSTEKEIQEFTIPLHESLASHQGENSGLLSFFEYVCIQAALLQHAEVEQIDVTQQYLEQVYRYFYLHLSTVSQKEEESSMEETKTEWNPFHSYEEEEKVKSFEQILQEDMKHELEDADQEELEEQHDEFFTEEADEEPSQTEKLYQIDFASLNEDLSYMFKAATESEEKKQVKMMKADLWELEMSEAATGFTETEVQQLSYYVLSMTFNTPDALKRQVQAAKQLLALVVQEG